MRRVFAGAAVAAGVIGILVLPGRDRGGILFRLENADARSLDSVVVFTTTNEYPLGSVRSGDAVEVLARSGGESHFEVEFGPPGGRTRIDVGGYFENGYVGSFRVRMTRDTVVVTDSRICASGC